MIYNITMWDSAKKPIKIKSVIQSDGTRRFHIRDNINETISPENTNFSDKKIFLKLKLPNFDRIEEEDEIHSLPLFSSPFSKKISPNFEDLSQYRDKYRSKDYDKNKDTLYVNANGNVNGNTTDKDNNDKNKDSAGTNIPHEFLEVNGNRVWRQSRRLFKSFDHRLLNERDFDLPLIHSSTNTHSSIYELFTLDKFNMAKANTLNSSSNNSNNSKNSANNPQENIFPLNWKQNSSWMKGNTFGNGNYNVSSNNVNRHNSRETRSLSPEIMSVSSSASILLEKETNSLCKRIMTWIDKEVKKNKGNLPTGIKGSDIRILNGISNANCNISPNSNVSEGKTDVQVELFAGEEQEKEKEKERKDVCRTVFVQTQTNGDGSAEDLKAKSNTSSTLSLCEPKKFQSLLKKSSIMSTVIGGSNWNGNGNGNGHGNGNWNGKAKERDIFDEAIYGGGFSSLSDNQKHNQIQQTEEKDMEKGKSKKSVTIVEDAEYLKQKRRRKKRRGESASRNEIGGNLHEGEAEETNLNCASNNGQIWGEVKLDDCVVYLMGETKARPICNIEVPENKEKVQLHIFLPVIDNNGSTTKEADNRSETISLISSKKY